jgi:hypothetical protein
MYPVIATFTDQNMQWHCTYCSGSVAHRRMNRKMFISKLPVKQGSSFNFANKHSSHNCNSVILNWLMVVMCEEREKTNKMFIINFCLNMFQASLCPSSGEQRLCVTAYGVLRWFCWMWLVAVVGR